MNCFNMHILLELTYLFKRCNVVCVFEIQFCKCRECLCMLYRVSLTISRLCLLAHHDQISHLANSLPRNNPRCHC